MNQIRSIKYQIRSIKYLVSSILYETERIISHFLFILDTKYKILNTFNKRESAQRGFTLVELLVSIGIFVVVTSVAVYNNSKFNASILLTNLSYEIALSVRQAQSYGISVKANASNTFTSAYGVHFDQNTTSYVLFEDINVNNTYDSGTDPILQTYTIRKGNTLGKIYLNNSTYVASVDVSFRRPDPDAKIKNSVSLYNKAEICVVSPRGDKRKILVEQTGQISVDPINTAVCN